VFRNVLSDHNRTHRPAHERATAIKEQESALTSAPINAPPAVVDLGWKTTDMNRKKKKRPSDNSGLDDEAMDVDQNVQDQDPSTACSPRHQIAYITNIILG